MKQPVAVLAQNLQTLREERNLSLTELSRVTGVSKSMLWQIEAGQSSPTIATLWKIANGLRVPFTAFLKQQDAEVVLRALKEDRPLQGESKGYRLFPLVPFDPERSFEIYHVEIDPGTALDAEPHQGNAKEYVFVVQGQIDITVDDKCYEVDDDHYLSFLANCSHRYQNSGSEMAVARMLISYLA
jgi:XRE family transcriptional regulator, regulator of sulfur utilization